MTFAQPVVDLVVQHQETLLHYKYAILLGVAFFEGTVTMITAGVLIASGVFWWPIALLVCTIAEIVDGFVWYSVGYFFGSKPIDYFIRNSPARQAFMAAVRKHSDRYAGLVVLAVKLTYSVTNPTLILVGSLKYNFKKYTVFNLIGSLGWAAILLSLGYTFGRAAFDHLRQFREAGFAVFLVLCSALALLALREIGVLYIKRIRREEQAEEVKEA